MGFFSDLGTSVSDFFQSLPVILSFIIPGLGQCLQGRFQVAIGHFLVATLIHSASKNSIPLILFSILVHLYSADEARLNKQRENQLPQNCFVVPYPLLTDSE